MPVVKPERVVVVPLPAIEPGLMVQLPVGSPLNATLPVAKAHVGWMMVPIIGADGIDGAELIIILPVGGEVNPVEFVTVYVYVPDDSPVIVVLFPEPVVVIPPGILVNVQVPDDGNPFKTTLPLTSPQPGCVIVPTKGAVGTSAVPVSSAEAVPLALKNPIPLV